MENPKKEKNTEKKNERQKFKKENRDSIDAIPRAKSVRCWTKKVNGNKFKKIQNKFICHKTNLI